MKKSFVIIKSFIITHLFILLLPLSLLSQTPLIEPSWDLRLIEEPAPGPQSCIYTNIIETDEGFYVVPLLHIDEYRNGKDDCADIIVINRDGEVMKEILLEYDENYIVNKIVLDIWNDTVNVFAHLISDARTHALIMHTYLYDDFSLGEYKEICRNDFGDKKRSEWDTMIASPLIDKEGNRTMFYRYTDYPEPSTNMSWFMMKFDSGLNLILKKEYYESELENNNFDVRFTYNADSTQYYMVSYRNDYPYYYFLNVFDMELNLTKSIPLESDTPIDLVVLNGCWSQNPYDGKIYAIGEVNHQLIKSEICVFKIDVELDDVEMLQFTDTSDDFMNNIVHGISNLCFLPNGDILGLTIWDVEEYIAYKPDAYYAYIPVFDTNMKKKGEYYYSIGKEYNQLFSQIHYTKDDGVIMSGNIRFKIDDEILWEPYIVKFPASAFDPDNIEEAHAHGLHLAVAYPNPGGDVMNIRTALRNATLSVYDMQGRIVHEQEITDDVTSIDASRWNSGTYIWKLTINNEQFTIKEVESGKWVKD